MLTWNLVTFYFMPVPKLSAKVIKGHQRSPMVKKVTKCYQKSPNVTIGHQRSPKNTKDHQRSKRSPTVTKGHQQLPKVTDRHPMSLKVTKGHIRSSNINWYVGIFDLYNFSKIAFKGHKRSHKLTKGYQI